jgi:hypothetical protein
MDTVGVSATSRAFVIWFAYEVPPTVKTGFFITNAPAGAGIAVPF